MISTPCVRWRGQSASYTTDEREIMSQLRVSEQALVHALKAICDGGELRSAFTDGEILVPGDDRGEKERSSAAGVGGGNGSSVQVPIPTVYTNPEDIEFGKPKRRKRIYALVTTWRQSCQVPTKREGEFWVKVWKAWHERQGWKVTSHPSGYFATDPAGARVAISLHEYDRETHERLN